MLEGIENKRQIQTLSIDNAWKIVTCAKYQLTKVQHNQKKCYRVTHNILLSETLTLY